MRILTWIQPSWDLHIWNYFGTIKQMLELQNSLSPSDEMFMFVADMHALTSLRDADALRHYVNNTILDYLACWLDPEKITLYVQSDIPEVAELMWYLSTVTPLWMLEQAHSFKDKAAKWLKPNAWLFIYPILMAADILIVNSDLVPVWKDQIQHVEMARDLAKKFNKQYWEVFIIPEHKIKSEVQVVPWVDWQKMSKSYKNTIQLFWDKKVIKKSIMSIVTDSKWVEEKKDPDNCNVVSIYKLFASEQELQAVMDKYRQWWYWYWEAKMALFEKIQDYFWEMWEKRSELESKQWLIDEIRELWAQKMRNASREVLEKCRIKTWIR